MHHLDLHLQLLNEQVGIGIFILIRIEHRPTHIRKEIPSSSESQIRTWNSPPRKFQVDGVRDAHRLKKIRHRRLHRRACRSPETISRRTFAKELPTLMTDVASSKLLKRSTNRLSTRPRKRYKTFTN